ncbi:hypothetical protein [Lacihabitans soyangensis]|uniref:Cytochrome B n=1 Tax=Lacihabitans soyangensis TaxID=869394 RepID=A0AAE3H1C5_9BACT|nr:hypothetical protein [Lacihabitans soyangensis]MCP9762251.1 hypothetical protein [Lacihabitans soyangensis]
MYSIILQAHHWIAFIALALLAYATINGAIGSNSEKVFDDSHRKINLFALITTHTMLLLGIVLLIISPVAQTAFADMGAAMKDGAVRKAVVEHPTMNIIAAVLVTIGNAKSKKAVGNGRKFKVSMIFFGLALLLILSRLPFEKLF